MCEHPHPFSDSLLLSCHHSYQPGQPEKHQSPVRTMASTHPRLGKGVVANSWQGNRPLKPRTTQILSRHTSNPAWEIPSQPCLRSELEKAIGGTHSTLDWDHQPLILEPINITD